MDGSGVMENVAPQQPLTRLERGADGGRYFHPNGYVLERQKRSWSERTGRMHGQADWPGPMYWWTVYHHIARRRSIIEGRPAKFLGHTSDRYYPKDFGTLAEARSWCDENPREGWS